ncbi:MAG: single-stranded-DNA-specific exonuclease RecJ [Anaerolineaceae bacterium]|nr:single-stranded-DNA-specific exonuclease RecJ [Anaerolineaceae bacterium]
MQPSLRKRWRILDRIPAELDEQFNGYSPLLRQLLYNRQIAGAESAHAFLTTSGSLHDPFLLLDMEAAVERILWAIDCHEPIAVYGDYDVDGVTATALLVQVLRRMGGEASGYIPNRFDEGYGLNNEALENLYQEGIRLVITVDCGIRSPREAELARQLGMDLIISDHHEPLEEIPVTRAVVCPKRPGDTYPEKNLAGVGLAYKIAEALLTRRPMPGFTQDDWLDLVAVGTVADVVPLVGENRSLVRAGLHYLRYSQRQGIRSLAGVSGWRIEAATARDIGFLLGPRLNAAGRLESALASFDLLMCDDLSTAGLLAQKLDDQNRQRQDLTRQMQETAEQLEPVGEDDFLVFASDPSFNMGVVGLVASRLTEAYYRPAVIAAVCEKYTRGSCRSIPEFHITHALDECADLLVRHGGHAMAAGFTVENEKLAELAARLKSIAARELAAQDLRPVLTADMEIQLRDLKPAILNEIDLLEPTGLGNPGVLFVSRGLKVLRYRKVGSDGQHLRLTVSDGKIIYDAIAFRMGCWAEEMPAYVDLLYTFEQNYYNGRVSLQLGVRDLKPSGEPDE